MEKLRDISLILIKRFIQLFYLTMKMIQNPVLRGFNPDPSILRVGDDYYIATSTFEWFPGVQIHHSRDLVNWELIKRPLDRKSQLDMVGNPDSGGIWAPCLTYSDGLFYLIYTDTKYWLTEPYKICTNYLVTAPDIMGPWSEPIYLNTSGFDPSLFHDVDGRKWLVNMEWDHRQQNNRFSGILLQEYDPETKNLVGPITKIFEGTDRALVEGPHLYNINGYYYLITAEGGTQYEHAVTVARSKKIDGPYEVHPDKHLVSSMGYPELKIQKAGHGSIVETQHGEWYLAHLCGRPVDGFHCILGRETSLQKCEWREDGWIYLTQGNMLPLETVEGPKGLEEQPSQTPKWNGKFDSAELDIHFQSLRQPMGEEWVSLSERPGYLRLKGKEPTVSLFRQSLIARRVQSLDIEVTTKVDYQPKSFQQMAGLIAYYDTQNHYYLRISRDEVLGRTLNILGTNAAKSCEVLPEDVSIPDEGEVSLKFTLKGSDLQFYYSMDASNWTPIGPVLNGNILSDDYNNLGFTGAFAGMCCQDITGQSFPADFAEFNYIQNQD